VNAGGESRRIDAHDPTRAPLIYQPLAESCAVATIRLYVSDL
jgi:hypothetical protein